MTMATEGHTAYESLGVSPAAPGELISACYWAMTAELRGRDGAETGATIHELTRAYEAVSDPVRRAEYNASIGSNPEPLTRRPLPRKRPFPLSLFGGKRQGLAWSVDPHEVLGLAPTAPQSCIPLAYGVMRDVYLRLPPRSQRRRKLLLMLEESYALLSDPVKRAELTQPLVTTSLEASAAAPAPPAVEPPAVEERKATLEGTSPQSDVNKPAESPASRRPQRAEPDTAVSRPARPLRQTDLAAEEPSASVDSGLRRLGRGAGAVAMIVLVALARAGAAAARVLWRLVCAGARLARMYASAGWKWLSGLRTSTARQHAKSEDAVSSPDDVFLGRIESRVRDVDRALPSDDEPAGSPVLGKDRSAYEDQ